MDTSPQTPRIRGDAVPPCFPSSGDVRVLLLGEAPGPRGADKSGIPFFGDRAGAPLYRALVAAGACVLPKRVADLPWDGDAFAAARLAPELRGVALGNAFDRCPTENGQKFRAPSRSELESDQNVTRLAHEIDRASARGLRRIVALGRVATNTAALVLERSPARWPHVQLTSVPHPSAQGLLSAAPDRGRGARLADLALAWEQVLVAVVQSELEASA